MLTRRSQNQNPATKGACEQEHLMGASHMRTVSTTVGSLCNKNRTRPSRLFSLSAHPTPGLGRVGRTQCGTTLGPDGGELDAESILLAEWGSKSLLHIASTKSTISILMFPWSLCRRKSSRQRNV
jgi:hypothetical protein